MKKNVKHSEKGFSVLEAIIVIAVLMIVATFAVFQMGNSNNQFKRENIAREFKIYLERSRFDSVRRRPDATEFAAMARVIINSASNYTVYYDMNQDGVIGANETRTVDFGQSDVRLSAGSAEFPVTVRFDSRGHITTEDGGGLVPAIFTFCTGTCVGDLAAANSTIVSISTTGTVAMVGGGEAIDSISVPGTNALDDDDGKVNTLVTTVTPTPGTTPTPIGTPIPIFTPPPGGTPAPTATPSPTPRECVTGESTNTGCICNNPRKVNDKFNNQCQEPGNSQGGGNGGGPKPK